MKKADFILIAAVLSAAVILFFVIRALSGREGASAEILVDGDVIMTVSLSEDAEYKINNDYGINIIAVKDGYITVTEADCRDNICVKHAGISKDGETIVCLPHKLVVRVIAQNPSDVDSVVS